MGVGCCCQCQVGKGEDGTPLRTASRIEMLCRDNQACLAVSFLYFYQFYTCIRGEAVVLKKTLVRSWGVMINV